MRRTTTTTTSGVALLAATLLLTGCTGGGDADPTATPTPTSAPDPTPSTPTPDADGTPTPAPTATTAPVATIPTDCTDIVDAQTYAATFGETPLNPEGYTLPDGSPRGVHTPTVPTGDAATWAVAEDLSELTCLWRDPRADITGITVSLGRTDATGASALRAAAAAEGATCTESGGATRCASTSTIEPYGADGAETTLLRDGVFVHVSQSNFPTDDLLGAITTRLWG